MKALDSSDHPPRFEPQTKPPFSNSTAEPTIQRTGQEQEKEAYLLEIQAEIYRREEALSEKEIKLKNLERELYEKDALLEARLKLMESTSNRVIEAGSEAEELDALKKLKAELDAQEAALKSSREELLDRERYVEECENTLVQKSTELTEREAALEQLEDNQKYDSAQAESKQG
jgi:chromosome segregation ATPase